MTNILVKLATVTATAITISVPALAIEQGRSGGVPVTRAAFQQAVKARFAAFDANGDGVVTKAEYDARRASVGAARRDARFGRLDADRNGQISRQEFAAHGDKAGRRGLHGNGAGRMAALGGFAAMDADKDGRVTLAEASARPLAAFEAADANRDGTVTPEERRAARIDARARWNARRG